MWLNLVSLICDMLFLLGKQCFRLLFIDFHLPGFPYHFHTYSYRILIASTVCSPQSYVIQYSIFLYFVLIIAFDGIAILFLKIKRDPFLLLSCDKKSPCEAEKQIANDDNRIYLEE